MNACFNWLGWMGVLSLASCFTVGNSPEHLDAEAKQFTSKPGKARIYVSREFKTKGAAAILTVHCDQKVVSKLSPGSYATFDVAPGHHSISVDCDGGPPGTVGADYGLEVEAGDVRYLNVAPQWMWRAEIESLTKERGMRIVQSCELVGAYGGVSQDPVSPEDSETESSGALFGGP